MKNFRTYQYAKVLYKKSKTVKLKYYIKDQLLRASSSVCLNLVEGSARNGTKDRLRFFNIAFASLREVQSIIDIENIEQLERDADVVAAHIYKLVHYDTDNS